MREKGLGRKGWQKYFHSLSDHMPVPSDQQKSVTVLKSPNNHNYKFNALMLVLFYPCT